MPQGPGGVIILGHDLDTPTKIKFPEPDIKRAIAFVDGQNLYHHARSAFNISHPNYDVLALTRTICQSKGWFFKAARFYTGTPELADDPKWHNFWSKKLLAIRRQGVHVYSRRLRYRDQIALDALASRCQTTSTWPSSLRQDQDMSEVVDEIKKIARFQKRWIKVACAYPFITYSKQSARNLTVRNGFRLIKPFTRSASINMTIVDCPNLPLRRWRRSSRCWSLVCNSTVKAPAAPGAGAIAQPSLAGAP